jgi:Asp/Glu/hydantoin racemase
MTRPEILLINPNTSAEITESIRLLAIDEVGDAATFSAVTADFGARYISSRASVSVAGHAVLDAYAATLARGIRPDAVIIACFGDPGLDALTEIAGVPVYGFADGGIEAAAALSGKFAIATIGTAWHDMLLELVHKRGLADRLAGIIALGEDSRDPAIAGPQIAERTFAIGAARVIIGGTGLIPTLDHIAQSVTLPVIDPHRTTIRMALSNALAGLAATSSYSADGPIFNGLSPWLSDLLTNGPAGVANTTTPEETIK